MTDFEKKRLALTVSGRVQGVGFRPFIWRLAQKYGLSGFVRNTSAGVRIEIQGTWGELRAFRDALENGLPPLAQVSGIDEENLPPLEEEADFSIEKSMGHAGQNILVSPDAGICGECQEDIRNPDNRRFGYPFTNCTNCGPRYSITAALPYDRPLTCMACFDLCPPCAGEYANPADRRFHAQPIACAHCGPVLWFVARKEQELGLTALTAANSERALDRACDLLAAGGILALKGLGGFQLVCDARNEIAVDQLRRRKHRPSKALAVMAADIGGIALFCDTTQAHIKLLESPARPIVLCPALQDSGQPLAAAIAPDTDHIGVMLPTTPLHVLLLDGLAARGLSSPALVMTSANAPGEPICLGNREALNRLAPLADAWLLHNRDILVRVDDSVVSVDGAFTAAGPPQPGREVPLFMRRARGYVPQPLPLPGGIAGESVLGAGAELKTTFCLTRGAQAFVSQHIGDLKSPSTLDFYRLVLAHMQNLLETRPAAVIHDLHPDFISTSFARQLAATLNIQCWSVQHHVAHAAACLGENSFCGPALALCLDGSGLGEDGTIWGGELIYMNLGEAQWGRLGALESFPLPGGDAAIHEPWRIAQAFMWMSGNGNLPAAPHKGAQVINEMLARDVNCPLTSSCGRFFDALSALLGLCAHASYEGQAPLMLEKLANQWLAQKGNGSAPHLCRPHIVEKDNLWRLDAQGLFDTAHRALRDGYEPGYIAAACHMDLARGFADLAAAVAARRGLHTVALSGGVLQNRLMASLLPRYLRAHGLTPLKHLELPPGDGCISYGQAVWGNSLLRQERKPAFDK